MDNTMPPQTPPATATSGEDKTVAIVAYITLIGFIAAIIIHTNKKTQLGAYHLRQMLGFFLTTVALGFCVFIGAFIPILNMLIFVCYWISMVVLFVFWIMGLIAAIQGQMKPMPLVGPLYQKWFSNTFN